MRALVRVGMKYGDGWALYSLTETKYLDGIWLRLEFRIRSTIDFKPQLVYIYPSGVIEIA
jgi:hypothetical protein